MKKFIFELTQEEINNILGGLAELPFKVSQPLINKLVEEYRKQAEPTEKVIAEPVND